MSFEDLESGRSLYIQGGDGSWGRQTKQAITNPSDSDNHQSIVAGVFQINTALTNFQRLVNTLGTPKDTLQLRQKLHSTRQQIGELIKGTSAKLKQTIESNRHSQFSATKKIADVKLAKDFQSVLKKFQKAQQLEAQREAAYTPFISQEIISSGSPELPISSSTSPDSGSIFLESKRQDIIQLEHEIVLNGAIIEEREQGIIEIQQQIGELNEMFKDLALLVHEQGTMLDDISSNIESSHDATAQAAKQLNKASKIQQCNSSMSCLLLVIFGVILLIIIVLVLA
ncbi:Syntaxin-21 [Capsicum annuum]|uniref:Syntaxin-21 n=1 Tax=Capsicum annuum TaxID=4072 RepID=A0A1U8H763_CAPAN|nr:syntaxin-22 [Capsicum annuum]KAF3639852.1 Syntaxin-21 [Capsicum annuum]PHT79882.1 Syntaxin-21 [Capsicum annuum]